MQIMSPIRIKEELKVLNMYLIYWKMLAVVYWKNYPEIGGTSS